MDGEPRQARSYLFLQGMATPFFAKLGIALAKRGHIVKRINFTAGDRLFWRMPGSVAYRGTLEDWPRTLEHHLNDWRITDIILFGDWRPLHAVAIRIARLRGLTVHVFEEGYLRPGWITLEQGGVNKNSSLSRDPAWFREIAATLPPWRDGVPTSGSFKFRACHDVLYNCFSMAFAWRHPGYRTHLPVPPMLEYAGWIRRWFRAAAVLRRAEAAMRGLAASGRPYFLVPLQLDSDSQLRVNSCFGRLAPAIEAILASFAAHAPPDSALLLKEHPFDNQWMDWRALALDAAKRLKVADRVFYVVGGDLTELMWKSRGVVTVNSTSGLTALSLGVPVATLGQPIYDLPGLTFQGGLDQFWHEGQTPDPSLVDAFRRVVVARTQINGDFFSTSGLALAVSGAVARLEGVAPDHVLTGLSIMPAALMAIGDEDALAHGAAD